MKLLIDVPRDFMRNIQWPDDITREPREVEAWIVEPDCPVTEEKLKEMPNLEVIATASTGTDHIDFDACEKRGITVFSLLDNRSALDEIRASSEFTFMLVLNALRRLDNAVQWKYWKRNAHYLRGRELYKKLVGLIGHGRIGKNIENWCRAFGAGVYWRDPHDKSSLFQPDVPWLFGACDVIVICCQLNATTRGMIDETLLSKMKQGACLVNTARGEVIDETGLVKVAKARPDLTFQLDVLSGEPEGKQHRSPLLEMDNVSVTPHIAGLTYESNEKAAEIALRLVQEYELKRVSREEQEEKQEKQAK